MVHSTLPTMVACLAALTVVKMAARMASKMAVHLGCLMLPNMVAYLVVLSKEVGILSCIPKDQVPLCGLWCIVLRKSPRHHYWHKGIIFLVFLHLAGQTVPTMVANLAALMDVTMAPLRASKTTGHLVGLTGPTMVPCLVELRVVTMAPQKASKTAVCSAG